MYAAIHSGTQAAQERTATTTARIDRAALACDRSAHGGTGAEPRSIHPRWIFHPGQRGVHSSGWLVA